MLLELCCSRERFLQKDHRDLSLPFDLPRRSLSFRCSLISLFLAGDCSCSCRYVGGCTRAYPRWERHPCTVLSDLAAAKQFNCSHNRTAFSVCASSVQDCYAGPRTYLSLALLYYVSLAHFVAAPRYSLQLCSTSDHETDFSLTPLGSS